MSFGGGSGSSSIAGSTDVVLNSPANNQVLGYNTSLAKWQNQTAVSLVAFNDLSAAVAAIQTQLGGVAPSWYSSLAPDGTVGVAYSFTFVATGTPAPTFAITAGSLPPGLTLTTGGVLSGTPTTANTYNYTITASNGIAPDIIRVKTIVIAASGGGGGGMTMYNSAIYGSGVAFDCKGNVVIYGQESMAVRFKAGTTSTLTGIQWTQRMGGTGYSLGTGGTTTITIQTNNAGKPSGTVLATTSWAGGNNPAGEERYDICSFSSPPSLTAGTIYYAVFENPSNTNYISANCGYTYSGGAANAVRSVNPKQPKFADSDYAVLLSTSYGGAWSETVNDAQGYNAVMDMIYADGWHDGQAYYENIGAGGYYGVISGTTNMVRESFTVSGGNRSVSSVGVRVRRHSGTSPLVLTLQNSAGTIIDSVSIPAANIQIPGNLAVSLTGDGGAVWASGNFSQARTLTNGTAYHLRLSTAAGTTYSIDPMRNASEQYYAFQSYDFKDGVSYYTTDGSTWAVMARDWMVGEMWDLPFYLT